MRYRLLTCFFVHESWKRDNEKENDKIKNYKITRKLKDLLSDVAVYLKLSFLKNSSQ